MAATNSRFQLLTLAPMKWAIIDVAHPQHDPRRVVACVFAIDESRCDVVWFREASLSRTFATPRDVLDALVRTSPVPHGLRSRRPNPVPVVRLPGGVPA